MAFCIESRPYCNNILPFWPQCATALLSQPPEKWPPQTPPQIIHDPDVTTTPADAKTLLGQRKRECPSRACVVNRLRTALTQNNPFPAALCRKGENSRHRRRDAQRKRKPRAPSGETTMDGVGNAEKKKRNCDSVDILTGGLPLGLVVGTSDAKSFLRQRKSVCHSLTCVFKAPSHRAHATTGHRHLACAAPCDSIMEARHCNDLCSLRPRPAEHLIQSGSLPNGRVFKAPSPRHPTQAGATSLQRRDHDGRRWKRHTKRKLRFCCARTPASLGWCTNDLVSAMMEAELNNTRFSVWRTTDINQTDTSKHSRTRQTSANAPRDFFMCQHANFSTTQTPRRTRQNCAYRFIAKSVHTKLYRLHVNKCANRRMWLARTIRTTPSAKNPKKTLHNYACANNHHL